ncbi:SCUBE2 [Branchiostoma lanceolatum]|uniref:SCUBE2 protein n=1 Tax=Branchiostoma lanceolatum TaxID=7740 RepID=A0A8K0E9Q3_BRALA|nr:SCUBE2 [Branchiostoma lanceolatum]
MLLMAGLGVVGPPVIPTHVTGGVTTAAHRQGPAAPVMLGSRGHAALQTSERNGSALARPVAQVVYGDIDECSSDNGGCDHTCVNTDGSYYCTCQSGYRLSGTHNCQDTDECSSENGGCQHTCTNADGEFECSCNPGYQLSELKYCTDVNECADNNGGCDQNCVNTVGSYHCACRPAYQLSGFGEMTCVERENIGCVNGTWTSQITCTCDPGYTGSSCNTEMRPWSFARCPSPRFEITLPEDRSYVEVDFRDILAVDAELNETKPMVDAASNITYPITKYKVTSNKTPSTEGYYLFAPVTFVAWKDTCAFSVIVKVCPPLRLPEFGAFVCHEDQQERRCALFCTEGKFRTKRLQDIFKCDLNSPSPMWTGADVDRVSCSEKGRYKHDLTVNMPCTPDDEAFYREVQGTLSDTKTWHLLCYNMSDVDCDITVSCANSNGQAEKSQRRLNRENGNLEEHRASDQLPGTVHQSGSAKRGTRDRSGSSPTRIPAWKKSKSTVAVAAYATGVSIIPASTTTKTTTSTTTSTTTTTAAAAKTTTDIQP